MTNGNVPMPLQNVYQFSQNVHHHFTRQTNHLHYMRGNNEFVYITFVFQSVFIWKKNIHNNNINVSYARFKHLLTDFVCYLMIFPFAMTNKTSHQCPLYSTHMLCLSQ